MGTGNRTLVLVIGVVGALIGLVIGVVIAPRVNPPSISSPASQPRGVVVIATNTPRPTHTPTLTRSPAPTHTPKPLPSWHEVTRFEGKGVKETEAFTIRGREWRISWETNANEAVSFGILQIEVHDADSQALMALAANVMAPDADSTIMRGAGNYYLSINAMQPYVIVVEERY